jgi:hypothetical protein
LKGYKKDGKFHPIRNKQSPRVRRQIGIVTGGLALGTKAVAKGVASGVAKGAGKSVTAIGTPLAQGLLSKIGSGAKGGLKGAGGLAKQGAKEAGLSVAGSAKNKLKGQLGQCHIVSINPQTGQVGGINLTGGSVKIDSCVLGAVAQSKSTDLNTISSGLFSSDFNSLPEEKKAVVLFLQQGNAKR